MDNDTQTLLLGWWRDRSLLQEMVIAAYASHNTAVLGRLLPQLESYPSPPSTPALLENDSKRKSRHLKILNASKELHSLLAEEYALIENK